MEFSLRLFFLDIVGSDVSASLRWCTWMWDADVLSLHCFNVNIWIRMFILEHFLLIQKKCRNVHMKVQKKLMHSLEYRPKVAFMKEKQLQIVFLKLFYFKFVAIIIYKSATFFHKTKNPKNKVFLFNFVIIKM